MLCFQLLVIPAFVCTSREKVFKITVIAAAKHPVCWQVRLQKLGHTGYFICYSGWHLHGVDSGPRLELQLVSSMDCSDEVLLHHFKLLSNDVKNKIFIRMAQEALPIGRMAGSLPPQQNAPNATISDCYCNRLVNHFRSASFWKVLWSLRLAVVSC